MRPRNRPAAPTARRRDRKASGTIDNLTHTLCGLALAEAGPRRRYGPAVVWLLVAAVNLPDLDYLLAFAGREAFVFARGGVTHSLPAAAALACGLALAFRRWSSLSSWPVLLGLSASGVALHLGLDASTAQGIGLFEPVSPARYGLGWTMSADPWLWACPAAGLLVGLLLPEHARACNRWGLAALAVLVAGSAASRTLAVSQFRERLARAGVAARDVRVEAYPQRDSRWRWNVLAFTPDRYYQGYVHALDGLDGRLRAYFIRPVPEELDGPFAAAYLRWARAPLLRPLAGEEEGALALCDLRFLEPEQGLPYVARLRPPSSVGVRWVDRPLASPAADQEFQLP